MIRVRGLCFDYPGVRALDDVSFSVERGSVVALVGPNGAGKTTLLRCLAALDRPVAGHISLEGEDALERPRWTHARVGYLPDFFGLFDALTVERCLRFHAAARGIAGAALDGTVRRAAERLGIADRLQTRAGTLSRGLRQRLAIAQAVVHEPPLLLLDEPTSGLDPEARASLSRLLRELARTGVTIIVSSHILSELEAYSTRMLMMRRGRIVGEEVVGAGAGARVRLALAAPFDGIAGVLQAVEGVSDVRSEGSRIEFLFDGDDAGRHGLLKRLLDRGVPVCAFAPVDRRLEELYIERVGAGAER